MTLTGSSLSGRLQTILDHRKLKQRHRSLKEYDEDTSARLVDFSSNDYLSLTTSPALRANYLARLESSPHFLGSTGSRLLSGSTPSHSALERRFAAFFNAPGALLFNSGWDANVSFFSTIPQQGDWVVYDELVHASVHSGMRVSRVSPEQRVPFRHNEPESLRQVLNAITAGPSSSTRSDGPIIFLALESLYSMDGDMAPLNTFLNILDEHVPRSRQCVVLDEAHSTGVYGKDGRGLTCALGEEGGWDHASNPKAGRVGVRLMTFGKAVGCSGAVLLCSPTVRSFLINFARPFIFSTALPHSTLHALEASFDTIQSTEGEQRRQSLFTLCRHLHAQLDGILAHCPKDILHLPPSHPNPFSPGLAHLEVDPPTPIIGLITPRPHALSLFLLDKGFIVRPVVPPTVPPGSERVRLCLRSGISSGVIDQLIDSLKEWVEAELQTRRGKSEVGVHSSGGLEGEMRLRAKL